MNDVEDRVRQALDDPRRDLSAPADPVGWVQERVASRQRQRRRALALAAASSIVVAAATGVVATTGGTASSPERLAGPPGASSAPGPAGAATTPLELGGRTFDVPVGLRLDTSTLREDLPAARAELHGSGQMLELLLVDNGLPYGSDRTPVVVAGRNAMLAQSPSGLLMLQVPLGGTSSLVVSGYRIDLDVLVDVAASGLD